MNDPLRQLPGFLARPMAFTLLCLLCACSDNQTDTATTTPVADSMTGTGPAGPVVPASMPPLQLGQGVPASLPPQPAPQQVPRSNSALRRFTPAIIIDATGFAQPMAAASLFMPHGWNAQGGVTWAQEHMCTNGYNFDWSASSPDGLMSVSLIPQAAWEANSTGSPANRPGCPLLNINSARGYLEAVVQQRIPGAQVLDYRERPDVLRELNAQDSRTPMPLGESRIWTEAGELLFGYQFQGRDMRGTVAAAVQFQSMITDMSSMYQNDPTLQGMPMGNMQTRMEALSAFAFPGWAAVAPDGAFDFGLFEALRRSIKTSPSWSQAIAGHNTRIGQVALEESRKRAQIINQTSDYISRLRQETWNAQQESADRRAREFGEAIRGVQSYVDPDAPGGTSEHSIQYDNVWRLNDGSYVLSDDPNFEPWRDLQLAGERLEPLR